jgi:hypothetical protein
LRRGYSVTKNRLSHTIVSKDNQNNSGYRFLN